MTTVYYHSPASIESADWSWIYRTSNDPKVQVGAILHLSDHREFYGSNRIDWAPNNLVDMRHVWLENRNIARGLVTHAEISAIKLALEAGVLNFAGSTLIVTLSPCENCRRLIEAVGIPEVYYAEVYTCGN